MVYYNANLNKYLVPSDIRNSYKKVNSRSTSLNVWTIEVVEYTYFHILNKLKINFS